MSDGGTPFTLASPSSDVQLPPYARRLDVRATRAAFAAGTLGTVRDDAFGENVKRDVEVRHPDGYYPDVMQPLPPIRGSREEWERYVESYAVSPTDHGPREWYDEAERLRQSRLRRWQTIR